MQYLLIKIVTELKICFFFGDWIFDYIKSKISSDIYHYEDINKTGLFIITKSNGTKVEKFLYSQNWYFPGFQIQELDIHGNNFGQIGIY